MAPAERNTRRVFYGWWNVAASFVGLSLSYAMFTVFSFGTFLTPLEKEFGWSRGEMSVAYTITNITVVFASPLVGSLVDRIGVRRVLIPSVILMGLAVASMYLLQGRLVYLYAMYLLIPLLGAGTLPLSYSRILVAWFVRRRGIALGTALAGFGVGASLVPPCGQWLIDHVGWREAYLVFGAAILVVSLPVTALMLRESPVEMGLGPDGDEVTPLRPLATGKALGLASAEARRTRSFWYIAGSFFLVGIGVTGVIAHLVPMLIDRGIEPASAALYMSSMGAGLVVGRILAGYLMDHFFAPYVSAAFLAAMCLGVVALALNLSGPILLVAVVCVGLAIGSEISEIAYIVSRYFGSRSFGQIYGTMFAAFQLGAAFGAPALGLYFDHAGDYVGALWGVATIVCLAVVLILRLGPYPDLVREHPV